MLHLANGESTAVRLRSADLPGVVASADDILLEGPPAELEQRARFLEAYLDIPRADYVRAWQQRLHLLARALEEDEAVLWFEEDVFCQLNYLHAMSWLAPRMRAATRITIVCPATERLGRLAPQQLAVLFERRQPLGAARLETAAATWQRFLDPDPTALWEWTRTHDFAAWPALRGGLVKQLQRLPHTGRGVGQIELAILRAAERGRSRFADLFDHVSSLEPDYGVPDSSVRRYIHDLARTEAALLELNDVEDAIELTGAGRAVLNGELDYLQVGRPDRYVGATHVTRECAWRWDAAAHALVSA